MLQESVDMAINALEEIQKYRAIGTVEECQTAMKRQNPIATIAEKEDTGTIASVIDAQLTAYDVDAVVEKLKRRSKEYNSGVRLHGKPEEMLTDEAIEIVKVGGADA